MILTSVKFKNFFSVGNDFINIDLTRFRKAIVTGGNGMGKSTILSAITFALFGKTIKQVTKSQIINSINNKACVVEIEGKAPDGKSFKVVRGIKPNVFEIYLDDQLVDQTLVGDYQSHLETYIIKCSFRTFLQTSVLSVENYKPFMTLTAGERRQFIEDILDIRVFSIMDGLVKAEIKKNKETIKDLNSKISSLRDTAEMLESHISKIENLAKSSSDELIGQLNQERTVLEQTKTALEQAISVSEGLHSISEDLTVKTRSRDSLKTSGISLKSDMERLKKTLSFFEENDVCPTCSQPIDKNHVAHVTKPHEEEYKSVMDELKSIAVKLQEFSSLSSEVTELNTKVAASNKSITELNYAISSSTKTITGYEKKIAELQISKSADEEKDKLKSTNVNLAAKENELSAINEEQDYNSMMAELFKDSGIKSTIVEQYIPVINAIVNEYLDRMDFFVSFELDSEFNETIKSRYRDAFSYNSFSAGEKQRIDLAIMFTMRRLANMKNSFSCNILCCDEVLDAAVDAAGVALINDIIMSEEFDSTNLIAISHRNTELFEDLFDGKYVLYKRDGFTQIREE